MYLETLKTFSTWVTVSEWAIKFGEMYPDMLEKANREAAGHKNPSTGQRELAARISSWVSTGGFGPSVEVDESERPRKVRFVTAEQQELHIEKEIAEDTEPLTRAQIIRRASEELNTKEQYRLEELQNISESLNSYFRLDFEVDHAMAILNPDNPGLHHPDNLQLILKSHNRTKSNSNWIRFSLEEQEKYIRAIIQVQSLVAKKMQVDLEESVIDALIARLKMIY